MYRDKGRKTYSSEGAGTNPLELGKENRKKKNLPFTLRQEKVLGPILHEDGEKDW